MSPNQSTAWLYATHDADATWVPRALPTAVAPPPPDFITANQGWVIGGKLAADGSYVFDKLFVTQDGGSSWTAVVRNMGLWGFSLDFVDDHLGWAVSTDPERPHLIQTTDGGRTWSELLPRLAS